MPAHIFLKSMRRKAILLLGYENAVFAPRIPPPLTDRGNLVISFRSIPYSVSSRKATN